VSEQSRDLLIAAMLHLIRCVSLCRYERGRYGCSLLKWFVSVPNIESK
jgi:hypothetical protein